MAMKKCKECNHEVSTKAKQCPQCGVERPGVGAVSIGGIFRAFVLLGVIGFFATCMAAVGSVGSGGKSQSTLHAAMNGSSVATENYRRANEWLSGSRFDTMVINATEVDSLGKSMFRKRAPEGARYVVVAYKVRNSTNETRTHLSSSMELVSSSGAHFEPNSEASVALMGNDKVKTAGFGEEIQPTMSGNFVEVFVLPNAISLQDVVIEVSGEVVKL